MTLRCERRVHVQLSMARASRRPGRSLGAWPDRGLGGPQKLATERRGPRPDTAWPERPAAALRRASRDSSPSASRAAVSSYFGCQARSRPVGLPEPLGPDGVRLARLHGPVDAGQDRSSAPRALDRHLQVAVSRVLTALLITAWSKRSCRVADLAGKVAPAGWRAPLVSPYAGRSGACNQHSSVHPDLPPRADGGVLHRHVRHRLVVARAHAIPRRDSVVITDPLTTSATGPTS